MLDKETFKKTVEKAIENGTPVVFRGLLSEFNPSWSEVLDHINTEYFYWDSLHKPDASGALDVSAGNVLIRGRFYMMTNISERSNFRTIEGAKEYIASYDPHFGLSMSFVSLLAEPGFPTLIHADPGHTFYWQVQGASRWRFYESTDSCVHCSADHSLSDAQLEPGDVIFAPKGSPHTVTTNGPRAAIVFRSDDEGAQKPLESTATLANIEEV